MKPLAKAYAISISVVGISVGLYCVYLLFNELSVSNDFAHELSQIVVLFLISLICRCLPIYIRDDYAIDMAFISNFAIILCKGPYIAAAITLIGSLFVIVPSPGPEREVKHIFNTEPLKTTFNMANLSLAVFLGGMVFVWCGGTVGNVMSTSILVPAVAMIFTIIIVNSVLLILLFKLNIGMPFFISVLKNLIDFLPSVIAAAPIGYFIARFMVVADGEYVVILFILPLLLARYSFTLYVYAKRNYYIMLKTLTYTLEAKDFYTRGHSERVEKYAIQLAREMRLSRTQIENISVAALLHDVGKIGIDENILNKPGKLTPEERLEIEKHPEISVSILKEVKLAPIIFEVVLHHHERYDGKGYPSRLGGEDLPIEVYVLGVADTYDAITSSRPYSEASPPEVARQIIINEKGKQFNPKVVEAFLRAYDKGDMALIKKEERELDLLLI
jgi:putative nucleotidyltransferase with HDIG domain